MNSDPESQSLIAQFLLLIVLTLINAFLAASEIAVVSINKNRVEQEAEEAMSSRKNYSKYWKTQLTFYPPSKWGLR